MSFEYADEDAVSSNIELDDGDVDILNDSLHNLSLEGRAYFDFVRFIYLVAAKLILLFDCLLKR